MSSFVPTSQAGQDTFAYIISGEDKEGFFVDIGCHDGFVHSNSYGLEQVGWSGLLVDKERGICTQPRNSYIVYSDASKPNPDLLAAYESLPPIVNYLSVDCDDDTFGALVAFPWDKVKCQTVTIEHDRYRVGDGPRDHIRAFMKSIGYELVCADVVAPGYGQFEDWWAHPVLSSARVRDLLRS